MQLPPYQSKRARIEIVPMIDTIFFLLVYFIIASLNMTQMSSRKVTLPSSVTANAHPGDKVIVTVTKDGRCYIDRTEIRLAGIKSALEAKFVNQPDLTVVINCDKDQPVAVFGDVFDLVKQANPRYVMVATTPKDSWTVR